MQMNNFNLGIYVVVTLITTVLLSGAYHNYFVRTRGKMVEKYEKIVATSQKSKLLPHQKFYFIF
jgi:hypothetical protein